MKKMTMTGMIAAMTIAAAMMAVPAMAQGQITQAQAKQIALENAGLKEEEVTFVRSHIDYDDGVMEYEVEFYSGNTEYDYDIDAMTGAIRSMDQDCEFYAPAAGNMADVKVPAGSTVNTNTPVGSITKDQAIEIALKHAGVAKADAAFIQVKPDFDDGMQQFDVEFHVGMTEYNYDIDASTGRIVDFDADIDD